MQTAPAWGCGRDPTAAPTRTLPRAAARGAAEISGRRRAWQRLAGRRPRAGRRPHSGHGAGAAAAPPCTLRGASRHGRVPASLCPPPPAHRRADDRGRVPDSPPRGGGCPAVAPVPAHGRRFQAVLTATPSRTTLSCSSGASSGGLVTPMPPPRLNMDGGCTGLGRPMAPPPPQPPRPTDPRGRPPTLPARGSAALAKVTAGSGLTGTATAVRRQSTRRRCGAPAAPARCGYKKKKEVASEVEIGRRLPTAPRTRPAVFSAANGRRVPSALATVATLPLESRCKAHTNLCHRR